jgi:hypothetical protein
VKDWVKSAGLVSVSYYYLHTDIIQYDIPFSSFFLGQNQSRSGSFGSLLVVVLLVVVASKAVAVDMTTQLTMNLVALVRAVQIAVITRFSFYEKKVRMM